jgi:hypothetical protein
MSQGIAFRVGELSPVPRVCPAYQSRVLGFSNTTPPRRTIVKDCFAIGGWHLNGTNFQVHIRLGV